MAKQSTSRVKIKIIWTLPPKLRGWHKNTDSVGVATQYEQTSELDQQGVNAEKPTASEK